jgi:hypothetical protein
MVTPTTPTPTPTRSQRRTISRRASLIVLAVAAAGAAGTAVVHASSDDSQLRELRRVTARFHDVQAAQAAGYERFVDLDGIACIANPGVGAMGVHYVNGALVGDPAIDALQPEALVYEPEGAGHGHHLVAAEYLVVKEAWDAVNDAPPSLYGTTFDTVTSPNRYGLPDFYALHVWIGKHNPAGTFAMWNPNVDC